MTYPFSTTGYAAAVAEMGPVVPIESLGIWALKRPIPGTAYFDAIALYPQCLPRAPQSRAQLCSELADLALVSLVCVVDPLAKDRSWYQDVFDMARVYKTHYFAEGPEAGRYGRHHRRYVRRAQKVCQTRAVSLGDYLEEWCTLYDGLISRNHLSEEHRFPRSYFENLVDLPGVDFFGAFIEGTLAAGVLLVKYKDWATGYLGATSEAGYRLGAAYALFDHFITYYTPATRVNLGGIADVSRPGADLSFFKKGFATATRDSWICGVIADPARYADLVGTAPATTYFPAYRAANG